MSDPVKLNLKIYQGATFEQSLRWEAGSKTYVPITSITNAAPVVITAPMHNAPEGWRVRITNVLGMKEINSPTEEYRSISNTTVDTFELNSVNSLGFAPYISGGVVEYNTPVDLTGYFGRMQVRVKPSDPIVLLELTSENGGIIVDTISKTISIYISATDTAGIPFTSGVYSLELVNIGGRVVRFVEGNISVVQEVSR